MTGSPSSTGQPAISPEIARCAVWWVDSQDGSRLEGLLSADELRRAARLSRWQARSGYIAGRALLRLVLSPLLGRDPTAIKIRQLCRVCGSREHGKPELVDSSVAFSISHAGDRVGVAVLDHGQVGLDVETTTNVSEDRLKAIASFALSQAERESYERLPAGLRDVAAVSWWTRKEAVLKATGWGLAIAPDTFQVVAPGRPPALLEWGAEQPPHPGTVHLFDVAPGPGYLGCLAVIGTPALVEEHDGTALLRRSRAR